MTKSTEKCCSKPSMVKNNGEYDLAVIGAGSAGFSAAIKASELGGRVALIGYGAIGGTCVNIGCVPSKTLIRAAETLHQADASSRFDGISGHASVIDWGAVSRQKDELVSGLRQAKYLDLLDAYENVTYIEGKARLSNGGVIVDGQKVRAGKVIVATGSSPFIPPIPGIDDVPVLTSTSALGLDRLPGSIMVVGAGYIGCELAQMFARFGVQVSILCRNCLLPDAEPEISAALGKYFRDEGIDIQDGVSYREIKQTSTGVALSFTRDGELKTLEADSVIMTTGRKPNSEGLGLSEAGIEIASNGGVHVDARMCSSHPDIFAAGDVTGRDMFVYMAAYGAKIAAENALSNSGSVRAYDAAMMPSVVFTDPQMATVGLTEATARDQGIEVDTSVLSLSSVPRYIAAYDTRGMIKLVASRGGGQLIGAHILAPEGSEIVQTAVMAIKAGMTVNELGEMIFPYLTGVEGLKLAAQTFNKDVTKLSCCA